MISYLREHGIAGALLRVLAGAGLYREINIYAAELPCTCLTPPQGIVVELLTPEILADYEALQAPQGALTPEQRLQRGDHCFLLRIDGAIAATIWTVASSFPLPYIGTRFHLNPSEIYFDGAYSVPTFRGQGLLPVLLAHASNFSLECGHSRALAIIVRSNRSSLRAFGKAGFRLWRRDSYIRLGPWRRNFSRSFS